MRIKINFLVGPQESLPETVKRRKLAWFGHVTRLDGLPKIIFQGTLEGGRRRGEQRQCWMDTIKEWTSLPMSELLTRASWRKKLEKDPCWIVPHVPPTSQSFKGLKWSDGYLFAGNSGRLSWVTLQQPQEQRYPFLPACAVLSCFQTVVYLPMLGIFNVRTDVTTRDCTQGLHGHRKRVCTESWLWEKKKIPFWIEPASAACRSDALPTELHPRPLRNDPLRY